MNKKTDNILPSTQSQPDKETNKKTGKGWIASILQFVAGQESEDLDERSTRDILKHMDAKWIWRQLRIVAIFFIFAMASITSGYITQTLQVRSNDLKKEVEDYRYRALTRSSELTRETRQSLIEEKLKANGDSTLTATPDAPFIIERDTKQ